MSFPETKQELDKRDCIIQAIEEVTNVPREHWELAMSKNRQEIFIRDIYIHMMKKVLGYDLKRIRNIVGLKSHSCVISAIRRFEKRSEELEHIHLIRLIRLEYEQRLANPIRVSAR
jgi:chromosomal replication initiation ATPase DnaA